MKTQKTNPEEFQDEHPQGKVYLKALGNWGEAIQKAKMECNIRTGSAGETTIF